MKNLDDLILNEYYKQSKQNAIMRKKYWRITRQLILKAFGRAIYKKFQCQELYRLEVENTAPEDQGIIQVKMFSSFSTSNLDDQQYVVLFSIDLNKPQVLYFQVGFWRKSKNKKEFTLLKDRFEVALSHDAKGQQVKEQHQLNLKIFLQKIISQTRHKIKTLITEKNNSEIRDILNERYNLTS